MNAALILLLALLPGAAAAQPAAPQPAPAADPISSDDDWSTGSSAGPKGCVAPVRMAGLIDQDPSDEQLPWRRTGPGKVSIYFDASKVTPQWRQDMEYGAAQWNKSPCIDACVVDACPPTANCVTAASGDKGDDGNFDAVERDGYTVGGHIDFLDTLSAPEKRNVAVHEMGHAIGLKHRKTKHVLMNGDTYNDVFTPDATEYRNLLFAYGRQQPALTELHQFPAPPAVSEPAYGDTPFSNATSDNSGSSGGTTGVPVSDASADRSGLPPEVLAAIKSLAGGYGRDRASSASASGDYTGRGDDEVDDEVDDDD